MDLFISEYGGFVLFIHVLSAIVWIGGLITLKYAVYSSLEKIADEKVMIARTLEITANAFRIITPFVLGSIITGILLEVGLNLADNINSSIKEGIWFLMTITYIYANIKRSKSEGYFISGHKEVAYTTFKVVHNVLIPFIIVLGIFALYFGVVLRGI